MSIRVGVIGTGAIGTDHAQKLSRAIARAELGGVTDVNAPRAAKVAAELGGVAVFRTGLELIASPEVDAVLIASTGETHANFVLACIAAGKPVLCEKPLAPTTPECELILKAEVAGGRRLVTVGFMRRYDVGYREVAASIASRAIGDVLLVHNVHRNARLAGSFTSFMSMTDAMIHEVDVTRWLVGEEIAAVQIVPTRQSLLANPDLQDPMFAVFTTESGVVSTVEFFGNCQYGYDVRCEVVGSAGTASLLNPVTASRVVAGVDTVSVPADWKMRFGVAYATEIQAWIDGLLGGEVTGPTAWDGYAATRATEAGVDALRSGERVRVEQVPRPEFYR